MSSRRRAVAARGPAIVTSHGSAYRYDTDVPLVLSGKAFRAGSYGEAEMVDLAATLSELLGISRPAACEGRPLYDALR